MKKIFAGLIALSCISSLIAAFPANTEDTSATISDSKAIEEMIVTTLNSDKETIVTPSDMPKIIDETKTITDEMKKMIWNKFKVTIPNTYLSCFKLVYNPINIFLKQRKYMGLMCTTMKCMCLIGIWWMIQVFG